MDTKERIRRITPQSLLCALRAWFGLCPHRHTLILLSLVVIALHLVTRGDRTWNTWLSDRLIAPAHRALGGLCEALPFSAAELLIMLLAAAVLGYLLWQLAALVFRGERLQRLYRTLSALLALSLAVYAGFCLLWGVYYYGDDFLVRSGLRDEPISTEDLARTTALFAALANASGEQVDRDEAGCCVFDRAAILVDSARLYERVARRFPCLDGPARHAKGVCFSRAMSYADFTGFFCPFTGEANVNLDFPCALFPATVAHELAHQRGVAQEQEANFAAVLACLENGESDWVYSASLLAYVHLGNALYKADREAWSTVYDGLSEGVRADLAASRAYWAQFETPVQTVSNTVYEGFLHSYNQSQGLKSYGACVDLLVNYYADVPLADFLAFLEKNP